MQPARVDRMLVALHPLDQDRKGLSPLLLLRAPRVGERAALHETARRLATPFGAAAAERVARPYRTRAARPRWARARTERQGRPARRLDHRCGRRDDQLLPAAAVDKREGAVLASLVPHAHGPRVDRRRRHISPLLGRGPLEPIAIKIDDKEPLQLHVARRGCQVHQHLNHRQVAPAQRQLQREREALVIVGRRALEHLLEGHRGGGTMAPRGAGRSRVLR